MNLTEELCKIAEARAGAAPPTDYYLFWRMVEIAQEMAKRIEALELSTRSTPPHCYTVHFDAETEEHLCRQAELERLREMHSMVRGAGEKPQTREEIRAELARLRELFDMEKEGREMNDG